MSASIRAVVETWGEHVTYLSRDLEIADLLEKLAEFAEDGHDHTGDLPELSKQVEYNEMTVVWIQNGRRFLNYLAITEPATIMERLSDDDAVSEDDEEAGRQLSDVKDICAMAAPGRDGWHKSIDPVDGGLRIYCD